MKNQKWSYLDFIIRLEYAFLENIYSQEVLEKTKILKNIELYYYVFQSFLKIITFMENDLTNSSTYDNNYHDELRDFLKKYCPAYHDNITDLMKKLKCSN